MQNELIFILESFIALSLILLAFRAGEKWLFSLVCVEIVLMNIFVLVQIDLFSLHATGGNVLYASIFLSTDLLSEHFGKKKALELVKMGFVVSLIFVLVTQIFIQFIPNDFDGGMMDHIKAIFSFAPRVFFGSICAYLVSQNFDVHFFDFIKEKTNGKFLWLRNNLSTFVSQLIDTIIFTSLGLLIIPSLEIFDFAKGIIHTNEFWDIVLFTYLIKILVAILDTPFIYLSKRKFFKQKN